MVPGAASKAGSIPSSGRICLGGEGSAAARGTSWPSDRAWGPGQTHDTLSGAMGVGDEPLAAICYVINSIENGLTKPKENALGPPRG